MPGGEWGFKEQVNTGSITPPQNLLIPAAEAVERVRVADEKREELMTVTAQSHRSFWEHNSPGVDGFEHWRFDEGVSQLSSDSRS